MNSNLLPPVSRRRLCMLGLTVLSIIPLATVVRAADALPGYVVVPISLMDRSNQAIIRATVNGRSAALILDTGASATVLDSSFYRGVRTKAGSKEESKLPPELQNKKVSANGENLEVGYVDSMKSGAMDFGAGPVIIADFSRLFSRYNNQHHASAISGLLGEDVLRKYSAIIDWRRRGVYFNTDPSKRLKLGPGLTGAGWTAVPMASTSGRHFTVACNVEDKPVRLVVDTGAVFTTFDKNAITLRHMMYNRDTGNSMNHLSSNQMSFTMLGMDNTAYLAKIENWKIGNYTVPSSVVITLQSPPGLVTQGTGGEGPVVGLLGAEVLASNNAIVDVAGGTLYLKPSAAAKAKTNKR